MRSQEDSAAGEAPSSSSSSSCHVLEGWQQTADARRYVNALLKRNKRKTFGMHTTPSAAPKHLQYSGLCLHMLKVWDCGLSMLGRSLVPTVDFVRAGEGKTTKKSLTPSPLGVLERPMLDQYNSTPLLHRRLLLMGRAGVGKTSTVNHLLGRGVCVCVCVCRLASCVS